MKRLLNVLILSALALPLWAGPEVPQPQSYSASLLAEVQDPKIKVSWLQHVTEQGNRTALAAAALLNKTEGLCCYHAGALYSLLETGRALAPAQLDFSDRPTSLAFVRDRLSRLLGVNLMSYENINLHHKPDSLSHWLATELQPGEPVMLGVFVDPRQLDLNDSVAHSVNALRIGDQAFVIDAGRDGRLLPAADFFRDGVADYSLDLSRRVAVMRTVRKGLRYQFSRGEVRGRSIAVNDLTLNLEHLPQSNLDRGLSYDELLYEYLRQRSRAQKRCTQSGVIAGSAADSAEKI